MDFISSAFNDWLLKNHNTTLDKVVRLPIDEFEKYQREYEKYGAEFYWKDPTRIFVTI